MNDAQDEVRYSPNDIRRIHGMPPQPGRSSLTPDICRIYDVPPWIVLAWYPRPRLARLRWALRRVWKLR